MVAGIAEGGAAAVEEEEESREGLGVPIVSVPATSPVNEVTFAIRNAGLPSPDEVKFAFKNYTCKSACTCTSLLRCLFFFH